MRWSPYVLIDDLRYHFHRRSNNDIEPKILLCLIFVVLNYFYGTVRDWYCLFVTDADYLAILRINARGQQRCAVGIPKEFLFLGIPRTSRDFQKGG